MTQFFSVTRNLTPNEVFTFKKLSFREKLNRIQLKP